MTSPRLIFAALLTSTCLLSCGSFEHIDSRQPTVAQQDAYDVSWGLPPRKARGNPKMRYQAKAEAPQTMSMAPAGPAAAAPAPMPAAAPAPAPISPTVPAGLR